MSKEKVIEFFNEAARDERLKTELGAVKNAEELANLAQQEGYAFSSENVEEAIADLKEQPGFFRTLAEAVLEIFSPSHDDYPATGVQPFSGDVSR
jgi:predicted ribosomally synthesized peptide with nif11-like leader